VTGTLPAGTIAVGDSLVTTSGERARVRDLEALGTTRSAVTGPARVALDLGGRAPESIGRGTPLLGEGSYPVTDVVDVALTGDDTVPARPQLHVGSAAVPVHARPLGDGFCRLVLDTPLPLHVGDRAVLRDPGDRRIWGVRVLDPLPPQLRRRGAARARAEALARLDGTVTAYVAMRGTARRDELDLLGLVGGPAGGTIEAGGWVVAPAETARLRAALVEAVGAAGAEGLTPAAAVHALALPTLAVAEALVAEPLEYVAGRIRKAGVTAAVSEELAAPLRRVRDLLAGNPFAAPTADELSAAGVADGTLVALHRAGLVLRLAPGIVLLPDAADVAVARLAALPQPFSTSQARQALDTSRRVALPLLAHLDAARRTVRLADDTRRIIRPTG
jgi:selenocysteine-specific elongation factor